MKKLLVCLAILCFGTVSCMAAETAFDLRGAVLGVHVNDVLKVEEGKAQGYNIDGKSAFFTLDEEVLGLKAESARYYLTPERTVRSIYLDYGKYEPGDLAALQDYQKLVAALEALYGVPEVNVNLKSGETVRLKGEGVYEDLSLLFPELLQSMATWRNDDAYLTATLRVVAKTKEKAIYILHGYNEQ